jgi:formylglycine-generating enzyme required for sulfatase activity
MMIFFRFAVNLLLCTLMASVLIGCEQSEPITQESIDQRLTLEQEILLLKDLVTQDFDRWNKVVISLGLLATDLVKDQSNNTLQLLSLESTNLSNQELFELISYLKKEGEHLNNSMSLLRAWHEVKGVAYSKKSSYGQYLIKYNMPVDSFEVDSLNKITEKEQNLDFLSAVNEYKLLIAIYSQKIKSMDEMLIRQKSAELAQKKWQSILPAKGIAASVASKAKMSWEIANKYFLVQQSSRAIKHFIEAKEQWLKAYELGLIALAYPLMVEVNGGQFTMGDEAGIGDKDERPLRSLNILSFNMSRTEITFSQYDAYAKANNIALPNDEGWGRGDRPVINVSWNEAQAFVKWLGDKTGNALRLPKEAEWEYAAKANRVNSLSENKAIFNLANCEGCYRWGNTETTPVAQFPANSFGFYDMQGNVWEWTDDCYKASTEGCQQKTVRGGSWNDLPTQLRVSNRSTAEMNKKSNRIGFRIVEDLNTTTFAQE